MSPHRIPNSALAELPDRGRLRVFLPGLWTENCKVQLDEEMLTAVYAALFTAIGFVDPITGSRWSPTYRAAVAKALKPNNRDLQWSNRPISRENTTLFLNTFVTHLRTLVDWAENVVFQVQVQGVKDLYHHRRTHSSAEKQLKKLLKPYDPAKGSWWIDVGMDIYMENFVLQWRTTGHASVFAHVLRISQEVANRTCHLGRQNYHRDISAHLPDLSGCRVSFKRSEGGEVEAAGAQLYGSDKHLLSHKSKNASAKMITGPMGIKGQPPAIFTDFYSMHIEAASTLSVSARIELRVPLHRERDVFMEPLPEWLLNASLLVFKRHTWWYVHQCLHNSHVTHARAHFTGDSAPSGSTPSASFCPCKIRLPLVPGSPCLP